MRSGSTEAFKIQPLKHLQTFDIEYDYGSIMHYSLFAFSKNGKPTMNPKRAYSGTIGQRDAPSQSDYLKIRYLYGCQKCKSHCLCSSMSLFLYLSLSVCLSLSLSVSFSLSHSLSPSLSLCLTSHCLCLSVSLPLCLSVFLSLCLCLCLFLLLGMVFPLTLNSFVLIKLHAINCIINSNNNNNNNP